MLSCFNYLFVLSNCLVWHTFPFQFRNVTTKHFKYIFFSFHPRRSLSCFVSLTSSLALPFLHLAAAISISLLQLFFSLQLLISLSFALCTVFSRSAALSISLKVLFTWLLLLLLFLFFLLPSLFTFWRISYFQTQNYSTFPSAVVYVLVGWREWYLQRKEFPLMVS